LGGAGRSGYVPTSTRHFVTIRKDSLEPLRTVELFRSSAAMKNSAHMAADWALLLRVGAGLEATRSSELNLFRHHTAHFPLPLAAVGLDGLGLPSKPFSHRI
jgi:hypothetical protein